MLVLILAFATFGCFGTAYYLFKTRWEHKVVRNPSTNMQTNKTIQVIEFELEPEDVLPEANGNELYLAYLPHSGFHNQRIAFENALILAQILNRTLLVPPVRLGNKPLRYVKFDTLKQLNILSDKEGLRHCARVERPCLLL